MSEFKEFPKIARLSRECVVTEKIDGTNAQIRIVLGGIEPAGPGGPTIGIDEDEVLARNAAGDVMLAGSRNRYLRPGKGDNFGFAAWVQANAEMLWALGDGRHYGEWWGSGIQRGYGLANGEKRFSLFNTARWSDPAVRPPCCSVVPLLYAGPFDTTAIHGQVRALEATGSLAAPGFKKPEGVVVFHTASGTLYKKTLEGDEKPKGSRE